MLMSEIKYEGKPKDISQKIYQYDSELLREM